MRPCHRSSALLSLLVAVWLPTCRAVAAAENPPSDGTGSNAATPSAAPDPERKIDPKQYPLGATVIGPPPALPPDTPVIKIDSPPPPAAQPAAKKGPSKDQPEADRKPRSLVPDNGGWKPTSAYAPHPDGAVYPWNPANWSKPVFDFNWKPAVPTREPLDQRNWSPVTWSRSIFDPIWTPTDSWGRKLGIEPKEAARKEPANSALDQTKESDENQVEERSETVSTPAAPSQAPERPPGDRPPR